LNRAESNHVEIESVEVESLKLNQSSEIRRIESVELNQSKSISRNEPDGLRHGFDRPIGSDGRRVA